MEASSQDQEPTDSPAPESIPQSEPIWARFPGTFSLIALTLSVFIGQLGLEQLLGFDALLEFGAKSRSEILSGEAWRLITPLFLHIGIPHIFVNMYSLYAIGPAVERFFGTPRFVLTYLQAGIAGVIVSLMFSPYPSAGASGAIFGMLGALAAFLYRHRNLFGRFGRLQLRQIILVALLNLGLGLLPGIDNWGHLGGLIAGAVLSWWLGPRYEIVWMWTDQGQLIDRSSWEISRSGYLIATGLLATLTLVALLAFSP